MQVCVRAPAPRGTKEPNMEPKSQVGLEPKWLRTCPVGLPVLPSRDSFKGAQGSIPGGTRVYPGILASPRMTFCGYFPTSFLKRFSDIHSAAFWSPKGPKRVPIGNHFRSFWTYRWKCENDGFGFAKPSFSWLEGIPRNPKSLSRKRFEKMT